ncbi:MAG: flagellar hook-associated protein FlgK [Phycisphaerales bacterium]|nr:flagellar hook-associated protein FlgK [Phycisphaerales bacterium]
MGSYNIGLSGLQVAERMMQLVSTNIANATTEGYHHQDVVVRPIVLNSYNGVGIGGAEVTEVKRNVNSLLELEITRQQVNLSQTNEELNILRTVEAAFGDLGSGGLAGAIDKFFGALTELSADPQNQALRVQAVWAGDAVAGEFRNIGRFLSDVEAQVQQQAEGFVNDFNALGAEVEDLTDEMDALAFQGGSSNILRDRRDQAVRQMAELGNIQVAGAEDETAASLRVSAWGTPVVSRSSLMEIEVTVLDDGNLGVGTKDSGVYRDNARGGKIGAMLEMKNEVISGIRSDLDALANHIANAVNDLHVQGLGASGAFTELTSITVEDIPVGQWTPPLAAGSVYVRVTDTSTGVVTRSQIDVDPTDTFSDVVASFDGVDGLSASISNSALSLNADLGHTFDFLPELMPTPYTSAITGDAPVTIDGVYTGSDNQIFTGQIVGTGRVGVDNGITLEIRDQGGQIIKTLNVGQGYAAGDILDIGSGMAISIGAGDFNDGDEFTIQAIGDSDTSGFLKATGINAFFSGTGAAGIAVRSDILADPSGRLAISRSSTGSDSQTVTRMTDLLSGPQAALGNASISDYYRGMVTGLGQLVVVSEARSKGLEGVMTQLNAQRDEISGVDLNEETAKLISIERMFQGMARVISAQDKAIGELMDLL